MKLKSLLTLFILGLLVACTSTSTTRIQKSWADPSLTNQTVKGYHKLMVIAILKGDWDRRIAETKLVNSFKNKQVVPSFEYLTPADTTKALVLEKLRTDSMDAVVLMRINEAQNTTTYHQGTTGYGPAYGYGYGGGYHGGYYGGYYGGYHGGYHTGYNTPGYYTEDKTYVVETFVFDVKQDKLMLSITTTTMNPSTIEKSIDQIIYSVRYEMMKKGLLKK